MADRPQGRKRNITGAGKGVFRRGSGLGTGPVGSGSGAGGFGTGGSGMNGLGRPGSGGGGRGRGSGTGRFSPLLIIALLIFFLLRGGGGLLQSAGSDGAAGSGSAQTGTNGTGFSGAGWESPSSADSASSFQAGAGEVDSSVAEGAREKYTKLVGGGKDRVTIMVYMCGTDLESRSGMATADLAEMAAADLGDRIRLLVYTGGCTGWRNSAVSSRTNQIYEVTGGGLRALVRDDGAKPMTDPDTLSAYIRWAAGEYPADRYELILWDHGGGSVSGYGYDEKYPKSGSMELSGIRRALRDGGVTFDFIGFDACLMATAETAFALDDHADYLIASEETEPGVGWYYTDWLGRFGANTSLSTPELGKHIADDFVEVCAQQCRGQKTTLSVVDIAEAAHTLPEKLNAFAQSVTERLEEKDYASISSARSSTREFAMSSGIDQVDLADLASRVGTPQGRELAEAVKSAVKYNRSSPGMTNAYGLSIYFPYQKMSYVTRAAANCDALGVEDYSRCIRQFASLETSGQAAAGGTGSPFPALSGGAFSGGTSAYSQSAYGAPDAGLISSLLESFLGGGYSSISGLTGDNTGYYSAGREVMEGEALTQYLTETHFDASRLVWQRTEAGEEVLSLPQEQWALVNDIDQNIFYDDGTGYIDLGLDDVFEWTEDGSLSADLSGAWVAVEGQPVAYYRMDTAQDGETFVRTGYVPALLNGDRVNLILVYDGGHPEGYIAGASYDYRGEIEVAAKNLTELAPGDTLEFLCDYYSYDGRYEDSYRLGDPMTVAGPPAVSDVTLGDGALRICYRFTDIYHEAYWSAPIMK